MRGYGRRPQKEIVVGRLLFPNILILNLQVRADLEGEHY